ncbi:MAG: hypothetical protein QM650_13465 [Microlunatus sp.]
MSQSSSAAATAAPAAATGTPPASASAPVPAPTPATAAAASSSRRRDTPRELRRLTTAVTAFSLVFGLLGLILFALLTWSMQRSSAATAQTIRIQQIQTDLLRADANATNAFLVGGLEPADQRDAYESAIDDASQLIAQSARAEPADQAALARLNVALVSYTDNIELARANNRQGYPIGAQYLQIASSDLRSEALPILNNLVDANAVRASSQMSVTGAIPLAIAELLLLGGLVWMQVWLARRFKRRFNVPLALATCIGLVSLIITTVLLSWAGINLTDIRDGDLADARAASNARVAANDAKSNESLTLIARGSGGSFEEAWKTSAASVSDSISRFRDLESMWQPYVDVHGQIRALDDDGQWDKAVAMATSKSNTAFDGFEQPIAQLVAQSGAATTAGLNKLAPWMIVGGLLAVAAGIAMAVLGRRGVELRLKEYR